MFDTGYVRGHGIGDIRNGAMSSMGDGAAPGTRSTAAPAAGRR
ncbi:hypothetical protein [Streptomyces flavofungini]|nr:hypothetical protein [Streptomyces flavofungini]